MGKKAASGAGRKDKVSRIRDEKNFLGFIEALLEREEQGYLAKIHLPAQTRRLAAKTIGLLGNILKAAQLAREVGNSRDAHKIYRWYLKCNRSDELDEAIFQMLIAVGSEADLRDYYVRFMTIEQMTEERSMERLRTYCSRLRNGRLLLPLVHLQITEFKRVAGTMSTEPTWDAKGVPDFIKPAVIIRNLMLANDLGEEEAKQILYRFGKWLHRKYGEKTIYSDAECPEAMWAWEMSGTPEGLQYAADAYSLEMRFLDAFRCFGKMGRREDQITMLKIAVEHGYLHEVLEAYGASDPKRVPPLEPELLEDLFDLAVDNARLRVLAGVEKYLDEHDNDDPFQVDRFHYDLMWKIACQKIEYMSGQCNLVRLEQQERAKYLALDLYAGGYYKIIYGLKLRLLVHLALGFVESALVCEQDLYRLVKTPIPLHKMRPFRFLDMAIELLMHVMQRERQERQEYSESGGVCGEVFPPAQINVLSLLDLLEAYRDKGLSTWRELPDDLPAFRSFLEQEGPKVLAAARDVYKSATAGIRLELKKLE